MKVKFIRSIEEGTSSAQLVANNKQIDFDYPTFIKRLYTGEQIEGVDYDPEEAFDATERETIEKMLEEIKVICTSNDENTESDSEVDDLGESSID